MSIHLRLGSSGLLLAVCLSFAPPAWCACTGPKQMEAQLHLHASAENYSLLGTWFGDHRQYVCAVEAYRSALKLDPQSPRLLYLLGLSLYTSGDMNGAVDALGKSIQIRPGEVKPHLILASALVRLQRNADAMEQWKAALQLEPSSQLALKGLSDLFLAEGDYGSTIALLQKAPPDEDLSLNLALAYIKSGLLDQAADTLARALHAEPSSVRLANALATVYVNQTRYQEAEQVAQKVAMLSPHNLEAQRLYLRVLVLNSDFTLARPLGKRLLAASPHDFDFLYLNGITEREDRQYAVARKHLEEAISINPNHYNSRYNLGLVLDQLQDYRGAREQFEKAIQLGDVEPEVRFSLSKTLRSLGDTAAATEQLKLYQQALKQKAARTLAAGKQAQADQALAAGDAQKAAGLYREAVAAMPENAQLSYKLALALDQTGDTADEAKALQTAIQIDPSFALALHQLGYLESRSGNLSSAEEHFRMAVHSAPGYTEAWISLAATLGMESHFAEAQVAVATALRLDPDNTEAQHLRQALTQAEAQH